MKWNRIAVALALALALELSSAAAAPRLPACTRTQQQTWIAGPVETIAEGITRQTFTNPADAAQQCAVLRRASRRTGRGR